MTVFDYAAADKTRVDFPTMTVFDTGQVLEPDLETEAYLDTSGPVNFNRVRKTGIVTFSNGQSTDVFSVQGHPSKLEDNTTVVVVEASNKMTRLKVVLNGDEVEIRDVGEPSPTVDWDGLLKWRMAARNATREDDKAENLENLMELLWEALSKFSPAPELPALDEDDAPSP